METLEKKIEEVAESYCNKHYFTSLEKQQCYRSFITGAKSSEAKEYWQQGMYSEEGVKRLVWESRSFFQEKKDIPWKHARTAFHNWFEQNKKEAV